MITDIYALLKLLDIECEDIRPRTQIRVPCPIHNGQGNNFCIHLEKEVYYCQVCQAGGSITRLIADKYNLSWREARKMMKKENIIGNERIEIQPRKPEDLKPHHELNSSMPEGIPLESKYRRILPDTMRKFGIYFCTNGYYTNSLIVPVYNELDVLVGFQARVIGTPVTPRAKYLFEQVKVKRIIYNYYRVKDYKRLFVVESVISTLNFYEHGYKNVVALLGSIWGEKRADILKDHDLILCLDRDEAGDNTRQKIKETDNINVVGEVVLPLGIEYDEMGQVYFDKYIKPFAGE